MKKHVAILGFVHAGFGALGVLAGLTVMIFGLAGGLLAWLGGGEDGGAVGGVLAVFGSWIGLFVMGSGAIGLLTGVGILGRKTWGRVLGLVTSVLNLFNWPWLTLLGIYGLWVLLSDGGRAEFQKAS